MPSKQLYLMSSKFTRKKYYSAKIFFLRIPKINIFSTEHNEFSISEDEFESIILDSSRVPLVTCFTKIGSKFILDATWEEEQASVGTVCVAFVPPDDIVLIKKIRHGTISTDSLPLLYEVIIN